MNDAFVYCWTDHLTKKLYIGSHKGTIDDGYVCSSKPMLKEYKERPKDFTRQIIAEGLYIDIRKLETKILTSLNAAQDDMFYNMHNSDSNFYLKGPLTEEHKRKLSVANKGKVATEETKKKLSMVRSGTKHPLYGKKHKESSKHKMSESRKGNKNSLGKLHTSETKEKISASRIGVKHTEETKEKIGRANKGRQPTLGLIQTAETRKKMSISQTNRWKKRKETCEV